MKINVLGAGVIGLSIAVRLLERGHEVSVLGRELPPGTTSDRAAAIWYPFAAAADERVRAWARETFEALAALARVEGAGVSFTDLTELFDQPRSAPWWAGIPAEFRIVGSDELPQGYSSGFRASVPLVETPIYLPWLMDRIRGLGGRIDHFSAPDLGAALGSAELLVNASGLGAAHLVPGETELYGLRGQAIRVEVGGRGRAFVDESGHHGLAYVVPRSGDTLLGGTATEVRDLSDESLRRALRPDPGVAERILAACREIEPGLKMRAVLAHTVGLRPARSRVRLDQERLPSGGRVLHCYGHGGSGFTLSWGCADAVCKLVEG